jgi:hypothetical protein
VLALVEETHALKPQACAAGVPRTIIAERDGVGAQRANCLEGKRAVVVLGIVDLRGARELLTKHVEPVVQGGRYVAAAEVLHLANDAQRLVGRERRRDVGSGERSDFAENLGHGALGEGREVCAHGVSSLPTPTIEAVALLGGPSLAAHLDRREAEHEGP